MQHRLVQSLQAETLELCHRKTKSTLQLDRRSCLCDHATISKQDNLHLSQATLQKRIILELRELLRPNLFSLSWIIENYQNSNYCNYGSDCIIVVRRYSIN